MYRFVTKLHVKTLLFRLQCFSALEPTDMAFMDDALRSDDPDVREEVLKLMVQFIAHLKEPLRSDVLQKASLWLQDETADIRRSVGVHGRIMLYLNFV